MYATRVAPQRGLKRGDYLWELIGSSQKDKEGLATRRLVEAHCAARLCSAVRPLDWAGRQQYSGLSRRMHATSCRMRGRPVHRPSPP